MIVKYSKKFPYAPWLNYDVGFEQEFIDLHTDNEEGILSALKKLDAIAEKFHKDNNPQIVEGGGNGDLTRMFSNVQMTVTNPPLQSVDISKEKSKDEKIIEQIMECSDLTVLKSFELLSKNNEKIEAAYEYRLNTIKQLT